MWELATTKEGIESWWGPEGFTTAVLVLDLRPGGELRYAMTATDPHQVAFMKSAGMPLTTEVKVTISEVVPQRRLTLVNLADFIPGVAPYETAATIELHPGPQGVRMVVTLDAMHDETWTGRAVMGWEQQLGRFERALAK